MLGGQTVLDSHPAAPLSRPNVLGECLNFPSLISPIYKMGLLMLLSQSCMRIEINKKVYALFLEHSTYVN